MKVKSPRRNRRARTATEDDMNKQARKPRNEKMYEAILSLKTMDECMRFFDDLCTVSELMAMEQRYQVASCLNDGMIYNDILAQTGASSATISRVNRSLQYGKGGYAVVFERLKEKEA
jgi:TrpR-related protein YerC/YecD